MKFPFDGGIAKRLLGRPDDMRPCRRGVVMARGQDLAERRGVR